MFRLITSILSILLVACIKLVMLNQALFAETDTLAGSSLQVPVESPSGLQADDANADDADDAEGGVKVALPTDANLNSDGGEESASMRGGDDGSLQDNQSPDSLPNSTNGDNIEKVGPEVNFTYDLHTPYDLSEDQRFSEKDGTQTFWISNSDKSFQEGSDTSPRSEVRVRGLDYENSGKYQFEADVYVFSGTNATCIMQIFGAQSRATAFMLRVYQDNSGNAMLTAYSDTSKPLASNVYNKWIHINVIHDAAQNVINVYIDGNLVHTENSETATHYFKYGVYNQDGAAELNKVAFRNVKIYKGS